VKNNELVCTNCGGELDPGQWAPGLCCACGISPFTGLGFEQRADDRVKVDHELGKIKVYIDPVFAKDPNAPIKMGYKGITRWSDKVQEEMIATLAALKYDELSENEKKAYRHFQYCISEWTLGRDPCDQGFFYCPYLPWGILDRTDIWENEGGACGSE